MTGMRSGMSATLRAFALLLNRTLTLPPKLVAEPLKPRGALTREQPSGLLGTRAHCLIDRDSTEYGVHVLDGDAEVRSPLDPLWAHPAIDAVGIDYYPPISDWRDGSGHADLAVACSQYDPDYLRERL